MQTRTTNKHWLQLLKMLVATNLAATLTAVVFLLLAAFLLDKLGLNESQAAIMIYAIYLITGIVAGLLAGKIKGTRKFMWGSLAGFVWFLVVLIVSLLGNDLGIAAKELFPAIVCMVGGGMMGGMLA